MIATIVAPAMIRRLWWVAGLAHETSADVRLQLERGCRRVVIRRACGRTIRDYRLPDVDMVCAPGDRYVCLGPGLDEAAELEITSVHAFGQLGARRLTGRLEATTERVQIALLCELDEPVIARAAARHAKAGAL